MRTLVVLAVASLVAAALGPTVHGDAFPVIVVDDRGQEVVIPSEPQRIVAIGALYAQIVVDLGAVGRLVGVADSPENPPEADGIASVGASFAPSVEVIVSLAPDLVLGASDWSGDRAALESVGIVVLSTPLLTSVGDVLSTVRTLGEALGAAQAAAQIIGSIAEEIVRIEAEALGAEPVRAAFLYPATPGDPPYAAGGDSIESELLFRAGAVNVFAGLSGFPQVSLESIIARDPEIIFTADSQVETLLGTAALGGVSAVRDGLVVGVKAADATSTRVAALLRTMVDALLGR
ncbi:MAG: ABC transporter substrate-binding protein [Candidatus Bipolaricaulota bacterium]|nr:MAG: ABC transporter substrate-binding protein [Candidatus Bipolaricaulota bacterium]